MKRSRTRTLRSCLVLLVVVLVNCSMVFGAEGKTKITIAHVWDSTLSHTQEGLEAAVRGFEARYPDIEVEILSSYHPDKFITEIAGGIPQDVIFVDGPLVSSWALRGLIQPLDGFLEKSQASREDFVPPALRQCMWDGQLWAMPIWVDPNFGFVWNKYMFEEAGLESDKAIKTISEFDAAFHKLTRFAPNGELEQIGMIPWEVYEFANTMYTWGWIFGGDFYDYENNRATAHHTANVEALEYIRDFFMKYSHLIAPLNLGMPFGAPVYRIPRGREAMSFLVTGHVAEIVRDFPDVEIGVGLPFSRTGENPAWAGGWTIAIPTGVKDPEAAWKLVEYLTADPEGTTLLSEVSGWFPSYIPSPVFQEKYAWDPYMKVYMQSLFELKNQRPVIPVQENYTTELGIAVIKSVLGEAQPKDALEHVSKTVDYEMERLLRALAEE